MAYTSGDTIEAAHYNAFVTSVNALWGSGTGNRGLGQTTTISTVSATDTITATTCATLLDRIRSISDHYGTDGSITIDTVTNPSGGDTIAAIKNTELENIHIQHHKQHSQYKSGARRKTNHRQKKYK